VATVAVATVSLSSSTFATSKSSSGSDYEYHGDNEVAELHDLVKCRHLALEDVDQERDYEARDEWCEKRPEMPSVKEGSRGPLLIVAGMRVAHSDNHTQPLWIAPVMKVSAPISNVSSQVTAVALQLSLVLKCFALVMPLEVAANLTPISAYLASVTANFACITSHLCFARCRSEHDECCTCKNFRNHCFSQVRSFSRDSAHALA